jgi:hypothetical protein
MELRLPNLKGTSCRLLVMCGRIETKEKRIIAWLKAHKKMIAKTKIDGEPVSIRLLCSDAQPENHFHLDIATAEVFEGKKLPKPTHKMAEIRKELDEVEELEVRTDVEGVFGVPVGDLPSIIQATLFETKVGEVTIKMTGGRLSVEGAPIQTINWSVPKGKKDATVILEGKMACKITASYLEDSWSLIRSAFTAFIQGGVPRGKGK